MDEPGRLCLLFRLRLTFHRKPGKRDRFKACPRNWFTGDFRISRRFRSRSARAPHHFAEVPRSCDSRLSAKSRSYASDPASAWRIAKAEASLPSARERIIPWATPAIQPTTASRSYSSFCLCLRMNGSSFFSRCSIPATPLRLIRCFLGFSWPSGARLLFTSGIFRRRFPDAKLASCLRLSCSPISPHNDSFSLIWP